MNLLAALVGGVLLGLVQLALESTSSASPDLAAVALALLLLRPSLRRAGARATGLLLGVSSCSLDPLGAILLGGGLAAWLLVSLRALVFGESPAAQALFGLVAALSFAVARSAYAWAGLAPALPRSGSAAAEPLLTAAAVPILAAAGSGLRRMARWSAARAGGRGDVAQRAPPS
jgi:hypothetical protein